LKFQNTDDLKASGPDTAGAGKLNGYIVNIFPAIGIVFRYHQNAC
jgi:hypothetical protein